MYSLENLLGTSNCIHKSIAPHFFPTAQTVFHCSPSTVLNSSPANAGDAGDMGLTPGSGRSPGVRNDNLLQYSCLENPMDRGAWRAAVHGVAKVGHDWVAEHGTHSPGIHSNPINVNLHKTVKVTFPKYVTDHVTWSVKTFQWFP